MTLFLYKPDMDPVSVQSFPQNVQLTPVRRHLEQDELTRSIGRIDLGSPPVFNAQPHFPYPPVLSPTGRSFVPGYPMTPNYSGVSVPFGAQFSSPQTPATGYTPGGFGTPSQYGSTSLTSGSPRYMGGTPNGQGWGSMGSPNRGSPLRGTPRMDSMGPPRTFGHHENAGRQMARPAFNSSVGQHNVVDVDRIRQGIDVRTTVRYPRDRPLTI